MRKGVCVPMIALCLLLAGCGGAEQAERQDLRAPYQEMRGCELTATVTCAQVNLEWQAVLRCRCEVDGESRVEVVAPEELAGVRAVIGPEDWRLEYGELCLNIGTLSSLNLSPAACPVLLMEALRQGWLLEENEEDWNGVPCLRLSLDQPAGQETKLISTVWLRREDGTPLRGEIAVDGEMVLSAEFTDFAFCDIVQEDKPAA